MLFTPGLVRTAPAISLSPASKHASHRAVKNMTYIICGIDGRERALKPQDVILSARRGSSASRAPAAKQVPLEIVRILDRRDVVVGRGELVGVVAEGGALALQEGALACAGAGGWDVEGFGVAWRGWVVSLVVGEGG